MQSFDILLCLESLFERSINEVSKITTFTDTDLSLFETVDKAANELLLDEFENYIERKFNSQAIEVLKKHDLIGIPIKKEYGGRGARPIVSTLCSERLGQVGLGGNSSVGVSIGLAGTCLEIWGTDDLKEKYLKPAATGDKILAYALTEPDAGSDPTSISSTFEEVDGNYVLNGTKYLITNGSICDAVVVFAYPKGDKNMSAFIVDKNSEGFDVSMELKEKLGFFTSDTALLEFDNVVIPKENVIGIPGKGLWVAYTALISGRMGVATGCVGVIEDCLNSVIERASTREQHGKLIGKHQLIQKHIADIAMSLEMAKWPTYICALKVEDWEKDPLNRDLRLDVDQSSSIAKRISSKLAFESADKAVQVFGGFGYSILSPVGRHFLDTRATRIYEGTDEIMDLKIASGVLGKDFEAYK